MTTAELTATVPQLTRRLADFARIDSAHLSTPVLDEATRAFTNWLGCVLGGCRENAAMLSGNAMANVNAMPQASIIGQRRYSDPESAAFVNCVSSSALAFDDTHLATVTHPTGPVAAASFALAQTRPVTGRELIEAIALGIEIQCRLSNALLLSPARANLGLYITGVTGAVGTAAAVGRLLGLEADQMTWALGLAAAQASGFRATHGSMAGSIVPSFAVRSGMLGARLAQQGITCSTNALEGTNGFLEVFAEGADPSAALSGLGEEFELFRNAYKPYPCGIVVHPAIDACLEAVAAGIAPSEIEALTLRVHPLAIKLANRPQPLSMLDAQVSLQHWASISLLRGKAGIAECRFDAVSAPASIELRDRVVLEANPNFGRSEAAVVLTLRSGTRVEHHVRHARGSTERPMTRSELREKFMTQARPIAGDDRTGQLLSICEELLVIPDAGAAFAEVLAEL
jgi:2-methylcitrate dehydratase PrpD